ncbi:hypothetical protein [Streptomyces sp. NPDC002588]|uniref:hypothetical protein n=1 Tax=Streptomyces sp. NPDC002588 TaxID=3154419 RepID=UPI00333274BD
MTSPLVAVDPPGNSPVRPYSCRTGRHRVSVSVTPDTSVRLSRLLTPFVSTLPAPESGFPRVAWSIRYDPGDSPYPPGHERIEPVSPGEPRSTLWLDRDRRELNIDPATPAGLAVHLVARYVRILLRLAHAAGAEELFLHGGLVAAGSHGYGRGVAVLGDKRAGKTSTVLAAMLDGAAFVANDDLSVRHEGERWIGRGWPRAVSVRPDTLPALGLGSGAGTAAGRLAHPAQTDSARTDSARTASPAGPAGPRRTFYPYELVDLLGAPPPRADAPLTALVFPRFSDLPGPAVLRELEPPEALGRLRRNLLRDPVKHADFLRDGSAGTAPDVSGALTALATAVPGYELTQHFSNLRAGAEHIAHLLHP